MSLRIFFASLALLPVFSSVVDAAKDSRPNIVFVMIDDLGAEAVGAYGGESYATPRMDALAKQGMQFNNAFAQPMCQISRSTLMSGLYGFRTGFKSNSDRPLSSKDGWGKGQASLANLLQDAGYTTVMSGKWHLSHLDHHPDHLTEQGFEYQNVWAHVIGGKRTRRYWESTYYREKEFITDGPGIYGPDVFCKYITDFMTAHKDDEKPFFAYYPLVLVHSPWPQTPDNINDPQSGWTAKDNLRTPETQKMSNPNFKSMVEYTDKVIGRVVDSIEDLGMAENTLLIVTGDNGTFRNFSSQYKGEALKGGKGQVSDIGTRVPFFAVWKGKIVPGSINENLIDFTDVLPTLVELGGGTLPEGKTYDGKSFAGQLLGDPKASSRNWVFAGNGAKAMARADKFSLDAAGQLYDLRENRYEPKPVKKGEFTEIHMTYHRMLSEAMQSLDHPYTAGLAKIGEKSGPSKSGKMKKNKKEKEK